MSSPTERNTKTRDMLRTSPVSRNTGGTLPDVRKFQPGCMWDTERSRVYFVGGAGLIKIGVTTDVDKRWRSLQLMSPVEIRYFGSFPGVQADEREMHAKFKHLRKHGEWFLDTEELRAEIVRLCGDLWFQERGAA